MTASRTVSVELQANVAGFVSGAKEAEQATDKLDKKLTDIGQHGKDFAEAEKSAVGLAAAMKEPTAAAGELGDKVGGAGRQMKETAVDARFLAAELAKVRTAALEAAAAFALTGDKAKLTEFRKQTAYANQLGRVDRALMGDAEKVGTQLGSQVGTSMLTELKTTFGGGFMKTLTNPYVLAALAPAGAELGAMLGAALLTGVGLAGVGAGIAGQISNPLVVAAGTALGAKVSDGFKQATGAFAQPLEDSLYSIGLEWDKLALGLHTTFDYLAPSVRILTNGALGFADALVPALERAAVAAEPLMSTLSGWLPQEGASLASLFDTLSSNAGMFNDALKLILGTVNLLTKAVDFTLNSFAGMFKLAEMTTGTLDAVIGSVHGAGDSMKFMAVNTGLATRTAAQLVTEQKALTAALDASNRAFEKQLKDLLASDRASIDYHQAVDDLTASVKENGHSLDVTTQKGRNNRRVLDEVISSLEKNYEANIAAGMSADKAGQAFAQQEGALRKQMAALHFSQDDINSYIAALERMRYAAIAANAAIRDVGTGQTHHDSFPGGATGGLWSDPGMIKHYSMGGFAKEPAIMFGEPQTGGEWLIPNQGISRDRAAMLLSNAAAAHGMALAGSVPAMGGGWGGMATAVGGTDNSVNLTVQAMRANLDYTELQAWQRSAEVRQRVGRPR